MERQTHGAEEIMSPGVRLSLASRFSRQQMDIRGIYFFSRDDALFSLASSHTQTLVTKHSPRSSLVVVVVSPSTRDPRRPSTQTHTQTTRANTHTQHNKNLEIR